MFGDRDGGRSFLCVVLPFCRFPLAHALCGYPRFVAETADQLLASVRIFSGLTMMAAFMGFVLTLIMK